MKKFQANMLPLLIGSLPVDDHAEAIEIVLKYSPQIPLWVQLPAHREEGMIEQFLPGMPGLTTSKEQTFIDTTGDGFDAEILHFYEEYMAVDAGASDQDTSRFVLDETTAAGFFTFMERIKRLPKAPVALKGQITGPVTFCTSVIDERGTAIFYNEQLRDAAIKLIGQKAGWQAKKMAEFKSPVIIFFDEPALTGFGSSAFISITREQIATCFEEVIEAVHAEGGLAGIHVCANADWSLILESDADIVSFDAYSFFEKFLLYPEQVKKFLASGRILAWGIIPTLKAEDIEKEDAGSIAENLEGKISQLEALGISRSIITAQSLITPSCGTGSLSLEHAEKVLRMTQEVSDRLRAH
jgi:methionine synthase II (cobalamin-independent)